MLYWRSRPTVCITCTGAGMDSAWEQKKLEARKCPYVLLGRFCLKRTGLIENIKNHQELSIFPL